MNMRVLILPFGIGCETKEFNWEAPSNIVAEALEQTFREFNVVEEGDSHIARECRSLSVGDVVVAEGKTYLCAQIGWTEIPTEKIDALKKMDFARRMFCEA